MDKGIVPIENAIEGTITLTTDGLVTNNVWIEGEAILPVALHLLTVEGADVDDIREVWSIAPALAQCRNFIRKMNAKIKHYSSTANAAASLVKADDKHAGAIASEWAAKTFGLEIAKKMFMISRGIQQDLSSFRKNIPRCPRPPNQCS